MSTTMSTHTSTVNTVALAVGSTIPTADTTTVFECSFEFFVILDENILLVLFATPHEQNTSMDTVMRSTRWV